MSEITEEELNKFTGQAPTVEEVNEGDLLYLETKIEEYKKAGLTETEAQAAANLDLKKRKEQQEATGHKLWNQLLKETKADKLLHDALIGALAVYKTEWEKVNKPRTIDFKFRYETKGAHYNKKGELLRIASVSLVLECAQNGLWEVWRHKTINFQHVREMRDGHGWKYRLNEVMLQDLVSFGVTYQLLLDGYRKGLITVPDDVNTPDGSGGTEIERAGEPAAQA